MHPSGIGVPQTSRRQTTRKKHGVSSPTSMREKIIVTLLALNISFLAYAYGGFPDWALWIFLSLSGASFLALFVPINDHTSPTMTSNITKLLKFPVFWLGLLVIAYILIQASNPAFIVIQEGKISFLRTLPHNTALPTSIDSPFNKINPYRILLYVISCLCISSSLWIGIRKRRSLQTLFWVFLANGLIFTAIGLYLRFKNISKLLGIKYTPINTMFSSFVYSNHAAAYIYLLLSVALGFCVYYLSSNLKSFNKSTPYLICGLIGVFLWLALFVIASRGGIVIASAITLCALCALIYVLVQARNNPYRKWIAISLIALLIGSAITLHYTYDWRRLDGRFDQFSTEISENSRRSLLREATYEMFEDNSVFGWGAGSFQYYFPVYRAKYPDLLYAKNSKRKYFYNHAHSDWIETLSDYGIVGSSLFALIGLYFFSLPVIFFRALNPLSFMVFIGCLGFIAHAYFDFVFQSPALLLTFCFLLTAAARAVSLRKRLLKS
ncbi:MAG: hypothetical protein COZ46_03280 [Verrucomicrobia bacterium CG_4_10_14_3_um_filter_43_23]|nr:MAG: hypothetical protein COX01_04205 [Verrucomicrobia bacterium CG22_combo_CG10-13_8_21_14_all_43_17]PIX58547.1 MAG: hypothetical protein COZ46_03280 [Verrucomicrobia bacterium CG_4_10_14_3_um_filter_43_23]PIY62345.1 MAG: hypothetical protein COY94_02205 [Verrucomicrobia bacterium CG_4_10_14_0_8_um_filter_43_34]PJA44063.1 MAG: hypothetical protein CO175_04790 [Verrucomicrobia bacterium CG_4_9_14_3_um_filter_43_20]